MTAPFAILAAAPPEPQIETIHFPLEMFTLAYIRGDLVPVNRDRLEHPGLAGEHGVRATGVVQRDATPESELAAARMLGFRDSLPPTR